jgi:hypothetical protein
MTTSAPPPRGVYHSRSRLTRQRVLLAVVGLALLLVGYGIGRLQGGPGAPAAASSPSPAPSPSPSAVAPSPTVDAPQGGTDAYGAIQAESFTGQQGTETEDTQDEGGGRDIGWINNGDWLRFDQINFGTAPATQFAARVASDVGGGVTGRLELRIDSPGNAPIGSLTVGNMGGWQKWQTQTTRVDPISGLHTLYVTFACDDGTEFLNLNFFAFGH